MTTQFKVYNLAMQVHQCTERLYIYSRFVIDGEVKDERRQGNESLYSRLFNCNPLPPTLYQLGIARTRTVYYRRIMNVSRLIRCEWMLCSAYQHWSAIPLYIDDTSGSVSPIIISYQIRCSIIRISFEQDNKPLMLLTYDLTRVCVDFLSFV